MKSIFSLCSLLSLLVVIFVVSEGGAAPRYDLTYEDFDVSGDGGHVTTGTVPTDSSGRMINPKKLVIADSRSWKVNHGIRVQRAGEFLLVHDANSGWVRVHPESGVKHEIDGVRKFVRCGIGAATTDERVDLCAIRFRNTMKFAHFDELHFWIKTSVSIGYGDLVIVLEDRNNGRVAKGRLEIPSTTSGRWIEVFLQIQGKREPNPEAGEDWGINKVSGLRLQCQRRCQNLEVSMDDFELVQDLVTNVHGIFPGPGSEATLQLNMEASRPVQNAVIFHDDTVAVQDWLNKAIPRGAYLFAPPGVYYISGTLGLHGQTRLTCSGPGSTVFKNTGRSRHGPKNMFLTVDDSVSSDITIEFCGFDANGWNKEDFFSFIFIQGVKDIAARNIRIQHNTLFDSRSPGADGCDQGQDACVTLQRQYIVVYNNVDEVWIEHNHLSGGGRIKAGEPGRNIFIRHNILDLVNDNAITIVDINKDEGCATRCVTRKCRNHRQCDL